MAQHWRDLFDEKFLGSWDILDKNTGKYIDKIVTIERFGKGDIETTKGKEKKNVVKFAEFKKEMVINKTNFKRLEAAHGSFDPIAFVGKQMTLTTEKARNPSDGTWIDALRFKKEAPTPVQLPALDENHTRWNDVKTAVSSGSYSMDQVKSRYSLSKNIEEILTALIPKK